jgi:ABC-2 type transport system permease protein
MRSRPMLAVARKDALDLILNPGTLGLLFIPLLVALVFALLGGTFGSRTARLLVYNPGGSAVERVLSAAFAPAQITRAATAAQVEAAFAPGAPGSYSAGLVVPADFEATARAGGQAHLGLYLNGAEVDAQQQALLQRALSDYARGLAQPVSPVAIQTTTLPTPDPIGGSLLFGPFYALLAVTTSFVVGVSLMPNLVVEEKERKTLWMLLVSPASLADVVAGKLLVGFSYQLGLSLVTLAVQQAFVGQVGVVLLFVVLGAAFGVALGLLVGSLFRTSASTGLFTGLIALVYFFPAFLAGPFAHFFIGSPLLWIVRLVPTYYLAEGLLSGLQQQATAGGVALESSVVLGTTLALFGAAVWTLRRQATVVASI